MPSDRIIHNKPNGLRYFHLKQLKRLTEWQLTGTFQQNNQQQQQKKHNGKKRNTSPPINGCCFFFWLALLFNVFQVPLKELERKSYVVSVVFEGRQCIKDS